MEVIKKPRVGKIMSGLPVNRDRQMNVLELIFPTGAPSVSRAAKSMHSSRLFQPGRRHIYLSMIGKTVTNT